MWQVTIAGDMLFLALVSAVRLVILVELARLVSVTYSNLELGFDCLSAFVAGCGLCFLR